VMILCCQAISVTDKDEDRKLTWEYQTVSG
jgi:hypothetical protein